MFSSLLQHSDPDALVQMLWRCLFFVLLSIDLMATRRIAPGLAVAAFVAQLAVAACAVTGTALLPVWLVIALTGYSMSFFSCSSWRCSSPWGSGLLGEGLCSPASPGPMRQARPCTIVPFRYLRSWPFWALRPSLPPSALREGGSSVRGRAFRLGPRAFRRSECYRSVLRCGLLA